VRPSGARLSRMADATGFDVGLVQGERDLRQILELQRRNLARNLSPEELCSDGFVTVEHTMDVLRRMHAIEPSVVAKRGEALAGYALMMPVACRSFIAVLEPMFERITNLHRHGRPLLEHRFYVMGQICVDAPFRGHGLFDSMYEEHKRQFASRFDFMITEVALSNARSLRAHERIGFESIDRYRDATNEWAVLLWDFGGGRS
jgi:ribosomal protein S18 acetylase RimI-like enzyme